MLKMPWQPLYSIERSGQPEVTVYGILSIVAERPFLPGNGKDLLSYGDVNYLLWSRSLLKPWQLLSHLPVIKKAYPQLKPEHFALMMSSHSGEQLHLDLLAEIMRIGKIAVADLQCPETLPLSVEKRLELEALGEKRSALYHNCSGKHLAYLLSLKAKGQPLDNYLNADHQEHCLLTEILSRFLNRPIDSFKSTIDGCQLPNYGLSTRELALLFQQLAQTGINYSQGRTRAPSDKEPTLACEQELLELQELMRRFPAIIGGRKRLDTRIMAGEFPPLAGSAAIAKEGADGLLAIGVLPREEYPHGLGIVIKLSAGESVKHHEAIVSELWHQLGLSQKEDKLTNQDNLFNERRKVRTDHIKSRFHFSLATMPSPEMCRHER